MNNILKKYNKGRIFEYDTERERTFASLEQLYTNNDETEIYPVEAMFINTKSRFGDAPVIVSGNFMVNFPQHTTSMVKDMIQDDEIVDMVNDGRVGFVIYSYKGKNGSGYSINWCEL